MAGMSKYARFSEEEAGNIKKLSPVKRFREGIDKYYISRRRIIREGKVRGKV